MNPNNYYIYKNLIENTDYKFDINSFKRFNYDFLKLEFNDIYEDLNKLKDQTNLEMINKEVINVKSSARVSPSGLLKVELN